MNTKRIYLLIVGLLVYAGAFSQAEVYVSPNGDDAAEGTLSAPFKTISKGISSVDDGGVVYLRGGDYRESLNITKSNIKIKAYSDETPVLKGSLVMTGWVSEGDYWKLSVETCPQQVFVDGNNPLQQIGMPKEVVNDATKRYMMPVGTGIDDMAPGRFWWENGTLYIWLEDSSNPNDHKIEVAKFDYIVDANAVGIYMKGLTFEHSNVNTYREQGAAVRLGTQSVLDSCIVQWCDFAGVSMGSESKVINSLVWHNGAVGIQASGEGGAYGYLIENTRMAYNNYRNFYSQWHTGGFKGATRAYGTIMNCEVDHNNGAGVWYDYAYKTDYDDNGTIYPLIICDNYFHGNGTNSYNGNDTLNNMPSITIEVSSYAYVFNNIVDTFQYRGIWVSSSWNSYFVNNIIANGTVESSYAIDGCASYVEQNQGWPYVKDNIIANNILYKYNATYAIRMEPDDGGTKFYNNVCSNNLIYNTPGRSVKFRHGSSTIYNLEKWQSDTEFGDNSIDDDPMFVLSGSGTEMYKLQNGSPAIDAGLNVLEDTMTTDYFGNPRIIGSKIDMGVFEHPDGLGIQQVSDKKEVSIYPNPARGYMLVPEGVVNAELVIFDVSGKEVMHLNNVNAFETINTTNLKGIYFVTLNAENIHSIQKVIFE